MNTPPKKQAQLALRLWSRLEALPHDVADDILYLLVTWNQQRRDEDSRSQSAKDCGETDKPLPFDGEKGGAA